MAKGEREYDVLGELSEDCTSIRLLHGKGFARVLSFMVGKQLRVRFQIFRALRSDAQNRYIHGVVVPTVQYWHKHSQGEEKSHDEVYTWLRTGLLGHKVVISEMLGQQVLTLEGKRFSKMTTKEFAEAIDVIVKEMAERDCIIMLPKENNFIHEFLKDE